jgi:MYXO-CTERM domain-containing protein
VLKWGSDADPSRDEIEGTLDALEDAWTVAFDEMQFDRPGFTNQYRINVYIGDSGGDTPTITGNVAAYVTMDDDGYAYVVVDPTTMPYFDDEWTRTYAASVLEHEFHHVVQFGSGAYYSQGGAWYWEASADWFADYAVPEAGLDAQDAFQFLLLPELPLDYFEPGDLSSLANIHQYSSSVFLIATTELDDGDWTPFRDSWTTASGSDDPIDVLDGLLPNGMASAYTDFARAMTLYDLSFGPTVAKWLDYYSTSGEYHTITAEVDAAGSDAPVDIDPSLFPGAFAFNVIEMRHPQPGSVIVTFAGDATGTRSTPSSFDVFVIADDTVTPVPLTSSSGSVEIPDASEIWEMRVLVISHPDATRSDETFPYTLTLAAGEPAPVDTAEPQDDWTPPQLEEADPVGCNCASTESSPVAWLALAGLAVILRRRDRPQNLR